MSRYVKRTLALLIALVAISGAQSTFAASPIPKADFHAAMRKLWEDHVTWTRLYLVSAIADLPDKGPTTERLMKNQTDIGIALQPFYTVTGGDRLTVLLKQHISTAAELVAAVKAGDGAKQADATKRWYANADDIAAFLSGANPKHWPAAEMKAMMREHLDMTTTEVVARIKSDWTGDIEAYDKLHLQILKMADMLADGIILQFPAKFK